VTYDALNIAVILAMAILTYATRIVGVIAMRGWRPEGRWAAAFEAVPAAVLTAVIAPTVIVTGLPETLAAAAAALAATRLPLLGTVAVGVLAVVVLRAAL
jgi:uncharacterized membrane protein